MRLFSDMPHLPHILSKTVRININWTCSHVQSMVESPASRAQSHCMSKGSDTDTELPKMHHTACNRLKYVLATRLPNTAHSQGVGLLSPLTPLTAH